MTQYRLRLRNGRVIGPFELKEIFELKMKSHISGEEECQEYPTGDWKLLRQFNFYLELMDEDRTSVFEESSNDKTFVLDLTSLRKQLNEKSIDELVESSDSHVESELDVTTIIAENSDETIILNDENETAILPSSERSSFEEKTIVQQRSKIFEEKEDKTQLNPLAQKQIAEMRIKLIEEEALERAKEKKRIEDEERKKQEAEALALIEKDDSTQVIRLDKIRDELILSAEQEEEHIKKQVIAIENENKKLLALEDKTPEVSNKSLRTKIISVVAIAVVLFVVFSPDDKKQERPPFQNLPAQITFPIPFDKSDEARSKIEYDKAKELYQVGSYPNLVKAGLLLKSSYENNLSNKEALSLLVRTYAEQLENSSQKAADSQTLFNIIQANRPVLINDPNGVIGLNLFYMYIDKKAAAADVIEKYLKLNPKNVTQDLFGAHMETLLKLGRIDNAKTFYSALDKAPEKNRYNYKALIEYLMVNQEFEKAEEYADDAIKNNPKLSLFYFYKVDFLIRNKDFAKAKIYLQKVEDLNYEYNNMDLARFLARTGLLLAAGGDVKMATKFLKRSLSIENSNSLRMKLAELSTTDGKEADTDELILESKAIKLIQTAQEHFANKNYELALSTAAKATEVYPGYIAAELFFAKTQLKLGLAEQALKTYERLADKHPSHFQANFDLINAYIETYKFNLAKNRIALISTTDMKADYRFASLQAKMHHKMGDLLQSQSWLKASLQMNPLNDNDIIMMGEAFMKRSSFDNARAMINRCIELDPVNIDYRIAYAKLIYETQDDRAAVGYLLNILDEFGEHPKLLGEIAIIYYRSGRIKDFLSFKERLEKTPVKDSALYEFLIRAALLDERYDDIPGYVEQLLLIEPGEIEAMMTAGRVLFENGKLPQAAVWFKKLQDRLSSYPKVLYYVSKIKLMSGDPDGAMVEIKKDIAANGENDSSLSLLAEINVAKGSLLEAENLYKKAQKLNPRSYTALVGLAELSTKRANYDLALDLYKRAARLQADEASLHKKVGDVYRLLGQGSLAIESYKLYLEMEPTASDRKQIESYIRIMD